MSYALVGDVADRLGREISDAAEITQVSTWLDDVEDAISSRFTRDGLVLADAIIAGDPSMATVVRIEAEAVIRRLLNPWGLTSVTRTLDDASFTERHEGETASSWLTDADWLALFPSAQNSGAFSTSPDFEPDYCAWP